MVMRLHSVDPSSIVGHATQPRRVAATTGGQRETAPHPGPSGQGCSPWRGAPSIPHETPRSPEGCPVVRVAAYVDGFNLYFGLKAKYGRRYLWLDLQALAASLLRPG